MRLLIASDSFKGTYSSAEVASFLKEGVLSVEPDCNVFCVEVSDGGEGFLEALSSADKRLKRVETETFDALMRPIVAPFLHDGKTAYVESALTCGLSRLALRKRNPLNTTTFGLGCQILSALQTGCDRIVIGLGGTGTHDCGMGMLQALGVRFYDASNRLIPDGSRAKELLFCKYADMAEIDETVAQTTFVAASDVKNPLVGENGAAKVFAPQKGADAPTVEILETGTVYACQVLERSCAKSLNFDGAGAAGGLGAALNVFKNVQTVSGADVVLKAADFEGLLRSDVDGVITGEGRTDGQTLFGKLPLKVASAAQKYGVPVLLVCGTAKAESDRLLLKGVTKIKPLFQESLSFETLLSDTPEALRKAGRDAVSFFKNG